MSEWQGPWKCEKCGATTCGNWAGEIEYADGKRHHFTLRGNKKGVMAIMCDGEMKPYDRRRADSQVVEDRLDAVLRWLRNRPGASWIATIRDIEEVLAAIRAQ